MCDGKPKRVAVTRTAVTAAAMSVTQSHLRLSRSLRLQSALLRFICLQVERILFALSRPDETFMAFACAEQHSGSECLRVVSRSTGSLSLGLSELTARSAEH